MAEEFTTEQILSNLSSEAAPASETPAGGVAEIAGVAAPAPSPWWSEKLKDEVEYTIEGGRKIKEPLEMTLKRAGVGYNYAQRAHLLNQKEEQFKSIEERNKALARWEEYDKYAKSNPDWAKHVEDGWNNRGNLQQSTNRDNPEFAQVTEKLTKLEKWYEDSQQKEIQARSSSEDKQMADEIGSVAKTYGVDLNQSDEQGRSLEWRILDHMEKLGLDKTEFRRGQFEAAFKDYYFDNLMNLKKEQEKEKQVKSNADRLKAGILDVSRSPKSKTSSNGYNPNLNWNQQAEAAIQYLREQNKQ